MMQTIGVSFEFGTLAESVWDYLTSSQASVIGLLGITVGILTYLITHFKEARRERRQANREVYQRLELASLELWRHESKDEMTRLFWEGSKLPVSKFDRMRLENAACQYLNLFEMAVQFRTDGVMPKQVFGSWVAWMLEFGQAKLLPEVWESIRLNYTVSIREIIFYSMQLHQDDNLCETEKRNCFFSHVADLFKCEIVRNWCKDRTDSKLPAVTNN